MANLRPKIVVVKEDYLAAEIANDSIAKVTKASKIHEDALSLMATEYEPEEKEIVCNNELNMVFTNLSDTEAKKLEKQPEIESIEDDVEVFALNDSLGDFIDDDQKATSWVNDEFSSFSSDYEEDIPTAQEAIHASQLVPEIDDLDISEEGIIEELGGSGYDNVEAAGIPRDKIGALIKCILKCAMQQHDGKVSEVSDDKITEILNTLNVKTCTCKPKVIRDFITCGLKIIYAPQAWRYSKGKRARVAIIDTGIASRHPDLRVYGGVSYVPGVRSWNDDNGHGTHVAGTVAALGNGRGVIGVAPSAELYAVKVLNSRGSGFMSGILNGLTWCATKGMHVANLSLGSQVNTHDPNVYSRAYNNAGIKLNKKGVLLVAAAGNSGSTRKPFVNNPARCPSFMAVSAVDCKRRRAPFSSYGPQVELCAPGVQVKSTYPPNTYKKLNGTSMACPHVAGVAALVKSRFPTWSPNAIRQHLDRTALDLGIPGRDKFFGYGLVNAYRAVQ